MDCKNQRENIRPMVFLMKISKKVELIQFKDKLLFFSLCFIYAKKWKNAGTQIIWEIAFEKKWQTLRKLNETKKVELCGETYVNNSDSCLEDCFSLVVEILQFCGFEGDHAISIILRKKNKRWIVMYLQYPFLKLCNSCWKGCLLNGC